MRCAGIELSRRISRNITIAAAVLAVARITHAADDTWKSASDGFFDEDANWADNSAPTASDTVNFTAAGTYQVRWDSITGNRTTQGVVVNAGDISLKVYTPATGSYTWTIHDAADSADLLIHGGAFTLGTSAVATQLVLDVDDALTLDAPGRLTVCYGNRIAAGTTTFDGATTIATGGVISSSSGRIGVANASGASVLVDGVGSAWMLMGDLTVGDLSDGALTITGGGFVGSANTQIGYEGGTGHVSVSGVGSVWTNSGMSVVGSSSDGILDVSGGAQVTSRRASMAANAGSTGTATIEGAGSAWNVTEDLTVGASGTGILTVRDGGHISSASAIVGAASPSNAPSTATVTGAGSRWAIYGPMDIGVTGTGAVDVTAGAQVNGNDVRVGREAGGSGSLHISGVGSQLNSMSVITIGQGGSGSMIVDDGGVVSSIGGSVASAAGSKGNITIDGAGSAWTMFASLAAGGSGSATLQITNGGRIGNLSGSVDGTSTATVDGTGSRWNNSMSLVIGNSGKGTLLVTNGGLVTSAASSIGSNAGSTGIVTVSGTGSRWTDTKSMQVGYKGSGSLSIAESAEVSVVDCLVGTTAGATGTVSVDGAGSRLTISASGTWPDNGTLAIGGDATRAGSAGSVSIGYEAEVSVGNAVKIWNNGTLNILGGTLRMAKPNALSLTGGALNYYAGTIAFDSDVSVGPGLSAVTNASLFGASPTISAGKTLEVAGKTTLLTPLTLNGGTFRTGSLANPALLQFDRGTLQLTASALDVGYSGLFGDTLQIGSGKHIEITQAASVAAEGLLTIADNASLKADSITNSGEIELSGRSARLAGNMLTNQGTLLGNGRVDARMENAVGGQIRVGPGQRLLLAGLENRNMGTIIVDHGQLDATSWVENYSSGAIHATGGVTLNFPVSLLNSGELNFSGGQSSVYGTVVLTPSARLGAGDQAHVSFFGDMQQNGIVTAGEGTRLSFYGDVSGAGRFSGNGIVEFLGTFSPGNSPADAQLTNVSFGPASTLKMELGGATAGMEYDQLTIPGNAALAGTLDVVLINGYLPKYGDRFTLIEGGTITGTPATIQFPALSDGLYWQTHQDTNSLTLSVVPEPSLAMLLATITGSSLLLRKRHAVTHER